MSGYGSGHSWAQAVGDLTRKAGQGRGPGTAFLTMAKRTYSAAAVWDLHSGDTIQILGPPLVTNICVGIQGVTSYPLPWWGGGLCKTMLATRLSMSTSKG